jgi:hypothetical protein
MNPKIEVIKWNLIEKQDIEKFHRELKQFAETHKVVNVSTAADYLMNGIRSIIVTILYEEEDKKISK